MIDYLERLFVREESGLEGEEDSGASSLLRKEESVESLPVSRLRDEEQWQQEAVRRLERALHMQEPAGRRLSEERAEELVRVAVSREEPGFETYPAPMTHFRGQPEREETLEHRLRRDSRRYDSGFFLY
jgi:hypothetical protein